MDTGKRKRTDVCYYSHHAQEMVHRGRDKVIKFIENGCVEYDRDRKCFIVKPIIGYNTRTYDIQRHEDGFSCNCQFYVMAQKRGEDVVCSHIASVYEHLARRNKANGWGKFKTQEVEIHV